MRFPLHAACRRTSNRDGRPCDDAENVQYVRVDRRTTDDPMKSPYIGKAWYDKGRNHRVENGQICRDIDDERWEIKLNDCEDLFNFIAKFGPIVAEVNERSSTEPFLELEIYDDYME